MDLFSGESPVRPFMHVYGDEHHGLTVHPFGCLPKELRRRRPIEASALFHNDEQDPDVFRESGAPKAKEVLGEKLALAVPVWILPKQPNLLLDRLGEMAVLPGLGAKLLRIGVAIDPRTPPPASGASASLPSGAALARATA